MTDTAYTDAERAALAAVLDTVIPPSADGRLPGAGALGLAEALEREVPVLAPLVKQALAALDASAGAGGFAALEADARAEALRAHAEHEPHFLPGLLFQLHTRYYTEPRVVEGLGMEARPPYPKGYAMAPSDWDTLLDPVRAGPQRYRDA